MNKHFREDFDAAVPLRSLYDHKDDARPSSKRVFEYLPMGFDEGAAKLTLYYKGASLSRRHENGLSVDDTIRDIAEISQHLEVYEARTQSLSGTFAKAVKRYASMAASFIAENIAIFGAAAGGGFVGGGVGGVVSSTAVTYPQVFGSSFLEALKEKGCALTDEAQIREALEDKDFVQGARRMSRAHAAKMSAAVFGAGALAGYVYGSVAKPVAQKGALVARSMLSGFSGVAKERGAKFLGDVFAKGVKSAANGAAKKAIQAIPSRAFLISGAAVEAGLEVAEYMEEGHDLLPRFMDVDYGGADYDSCAVHASVNCRLPNYNLSTLYI